jgi:hypothetical protein
VFEHPEAIRIGWLTGKLNEGDRPTSDGRFVTR